MKKFCVVAALLMVTTAAHAGNSISFEIDGHKIRIEAPKNCDSLSCVQISAPSLTSSGLGFKDIKSKLFDNNDDVAQRTDPPAPKSAPAPVAQTVTPPPSAPAAVSAAPAATAVAAASPAPAVGFDAPSAPAPAVVSTPAPKQAAIAAAPAPTTPLGIWATEENKGNVRIELCGQNLCGYAENSGEQILINMKPSDNKWVGRIHDPDGGSNYDSTIAMKGPNTLKVQGCAFGGMFCGGQTWKRIS